MLVFFLVNNIPVRYIGNQYKWVIIVYIVTLYTIMQDKNNAEKWWIMFFVLPNRITEIKIVNINKFL